MGWEVRGDSDRVGGRDAVGSFDVGVANQTRRVACNWWRGNCSLDPNRMYPRVVTRAPQLDKRHMKKRTAQRLHILCKYSFDNVDPHTLENDM